MPIPDEWLPFVPAPRPLAPGEKWHVFLSYRSVNRTWVLNLYDVLRHQGFSVFLDQCALTGGDSLVRTLEDGLAASQAGILVWTDAARDSEWVRREYETLESMVTRKKGFHFVPVKLDKSVLPVFAERRVFLDFSSYPDGPNGGELLALLHAITGRPLTPEAAEFANDQDEKAKLAGSEIGAAVRNRDPELLQELYDKGGLPWKTSSALGCKAAEGLTKLGRPDDAIAICENLEQQFPNAIRPRQLHSLALARRARAGDLRQAQRILGALYESGQRDPETLGIYGRTWMDRYEQSGDLSDLKQSRDLYAEAFRTALDDYYTGINAAAKSVFLGEMEEAANYAEQVQAIVGTEPKSGDYWMTATVAEVFLIRRKYAEAARLYDAAVGMARSEVGSHESTWKQARRLMDKLGPSDEDRVRVGRAFAHLPRS